MFSTTHVRMYVAGFLLWCVLSSNHILIYNEETLVALSFFLFVYLVHKYAGDSIGASMDSRGQEIAAELEQYLIAREAALQALSQAHMATSHLQPHMASLGHGVTQAMAHYAAGCSNMVQRDITRGIEARCAYLSSLGTGSQARMLDRVAHGLPALVMLEHGTGVSGVSSATVQQALQALSA